MIRLELPVPPSTNGLYANNKRTGGRYKTPKYRAWQREADGYLFNQMPITGITSGGVSLVIKLPSETRGDVSNRIKAVEDYLVSRKLTVDDRFHAKVSVERADVSCCIVEIYPVEGK